MSASVFPPQSPGCFGKLFHENLSGRQEKTTFFILPKGIRGSSLTAKQDCFQCGKCCEKWGWDQRGIIEDIIPWILAARTDILQHVGIRFSDGSFTTGAGLALSDVPRIARIEYWVTPGGRKLRHCPFFFRAEDNKAYCRIHGAKPAVCVEFAPWNEGIRDYALSCPACRDPTP